MRELGGAVVRLVVALAVLAGGYLGMAWYLGRHVPANASVAGVPIGGMEPAKAETTLKRALAARATAPVKLTAGAKTAELDPSAAGLALDLPETLKGLSGFSAKPADVWNHLNGGKAEPLRTSVDRARLDAAVAEAAKALTTPAKEGSITFPGGKLRVVQPVTGLSVDAAKTADAIAAQWPTGEPVQASSTKVEPKVSAAEIARASKQFAAPAVSRPVIAVVGANKFTLQPAQFAPAITMKADPAKGTLTPVVDSAKVVALVRRAADEAGLVREPRDAEITFSGTSATVIPSTPGLKIDDASIVKGFTPALTSPTRTVVVKTTVLQPRLTTAQAEKIKPKEVISTFTTHFPDNPPRTQNIRIATRTLNGTYVGPGEQFSLNGTLGQRTAGKGYSEAPVILNGRLVKDYGGGVSQVSTTTFNAAFFSGVRIDQYLPHSFYIPRYPEGREATVSWPDVDQKWTNDTGYGILIQAYTSGNSITVTFHGTKVWDIESVKGPRRNVKPPKKIVDDRESCVPQEPTPGFDVTVTRIFRKNGAEVRRSHFNTHYIPEDQVTCTHPQAG